MGAVRGAEAPASRARGDSTRAREPFATGVARRDGGRIAWELYGAGDQPIMFVPPWQIVHSRVWKLQIPEFARRHLVIAWDARGNGASDRPLDPSAHTMRARAADLGAVLDDVGVDAAVLVGLSSAAGPMVVFATEHPERALALVFVCPSTPLGEPGSAAHVPFEEPLPSDEGWNKKNIHYWRRDYRGYLDLFFSQAFPEPHSTKPHEDAIGYGSDTDAESLAATVRAPASVDPETYRAICASIRRPVLVIQGTDERISHVTQATGLAAAIPGARLEFVGGGGHIVSVRDPVRVNLLIRSFLREIGLGR